MNSSGPNSSMKMNNTSVKSNSQRRYSGRITRPRSNSRIYSPGHKENRKWIRLLTACGYIFFVSSPAVFLSYYYIVVWDPTYIEKHHHYNLSNRKIALEPKSATRLRREFEESLNENDVPFRRLPVDNIVSTSESCHCQCPTISPHRNSLKIGLKEILKPKEIAIPHIQDTIRRLPTEHN
uniref:Transmembrane protein n=1 Tax=Acrobeloides nanus TaxID=290746 RepID=A0A914E9V1_9BILA